MADATVSAQPAAETVEASVREPELSREVQQHMQQDIDEVQSSMAQGGDKTLVERAKSVVASMVGTLKRFDPSITREKLSNTVHGLVHSNTMLLARLDERLRTTLRRYVPLDRTKWFADDIERHVAAHTEAVEKLTLRLRAALQAARVKAGEAATSPKTKTVALSGAGAAAVLGAAGASVGLAGGAVAGAAAGAVPAVLTFGLSVPVGAVVGGSLAAAAGAGTGAVAGLLGGGAGGAVYVYRDELRNGAHAAQVKAVEVASHTCGRARESLGAAKTLTQQSVASATEAVNGVVSRTREELAQAAGTARERVLDSFSAAKSLTERSVSSTRETVAGAAGRTKDAVLELTAGARTVASNSQVQVGAASAAGAAVVGGATVGTAGLLAGGAAGAACGLPAALLTLGLSVPVGAVLGGGAGLLAGATAGGAAGLVAGAAGYGAYTKADELRGGAADAFAKAQELLEVVKARASRVTGGAAVAA